MLPSHARRNGSLPSSLIGDTQFRAWVALATGARFPSKIKAFYVFAFVARVPVSSHLSCVCGSGFPRAFTSSLICFVWRFPGNCRSGMSFQLMDPDAKLSKFTTRVAAAVSPS